MATELHGLLRFEEPVVLTLGHYSGERPGAGTAALHTGVLRHWDLWGHASNRPWNFCESEAAIVKDTSLSLIRVVIEGLPSLICAWHFAMNGVVILDVVLMVLALWLRSFDRWREKTIDNKLAIRVGAG